MKCEVVGFHLKLVNAGAFGVDSQREFVGMRRFHRDFEIKGAAGAQFDMINAAGQRSDRSMGRALTYAVYCSRQLRAKFTARGIYGDLCHTSRPLIAELNGLMR